MRIQHNIMALNSNRQLGINNSAVSKSLEKLSSGFRINRAGDDAAGLAISEQMRSQINGLNQAAVNANDAIGLIQTAEGALTEVHSMLQRMTTLATQAANGTYNSVARGNIQSEMNELMAEIDRVANNTDFNGIKPLESKNGYDAATDAVGGSITADRSGKSHKMTFQIGPTAGETILVSGQSMTVSGIFNATRATYNGMATGAMGTGHILYVGTNTTTYANRAITAIKSAIDTVSSYRAKLGAAQNRLEHTISNLEVTSENITAAESRIRDTDMADEITNYTKNNILLQAAQSMLSQANAAPQGVLSLLQ